MMKSFILLPFSAMIFSCTQPEPPPIVSVKTHSKGETTEIVQRRQPSPPASVSPQVISTTGSAQSGSRRLGHWRFNRGSDWRAEQGQVPMQALNLTNVPSFDGGALLMNNSKGVSLLKFGTVENNGQTNLAFENGSIRFLFKPHWQSTTTGFGRGPRQWARLVSLGEPGTSPAGWFDLAIDPLGKNLCFQCQDASGTNGWAAPILFYSNNWYTISLTLSNNPATGTNQIALWIDTRKILDVTTRELHLPPVDVRRKGFSIGSNLGGTEPALGAIDEFETFNYAIGGLENNEEYTVLSAEVSVTPPSIHLSWRVTPQARPPSIFRRTPGETAWLTLATNVSAWSFTDAKVSIGKRYEYEVRWNASQTGRYLLAGLNAPPIEDRGKVILLVEQSAADALATELQTLTSDLVGDGWTVIRKNVPRHDPLNFAKNPPNVAAIKSFITNTYYADPAHTRALFILGHVSVPYSGAAAEDGHFSTPQDPGNHFGAWPTDCYYADVDGQWTDRLVNYTNTFTPRLQNLIGDGKFDQNVIPTNAAGRAELELAFGRVDLDAIGLFQPAYEVELLRRYLKKDHRYRHKEFSFGQRVIAAGYIPGNEHPTYSQAARNGSSLFGLETGKLFEGDLFAQKESALWGYQSGFGSLDSIYSDRQFGIVHTSAEMANPAKEPPVGFYTLAGSYFGEWYTSDNLMRVTLGNANYSLGVMWAHNIDWLFEPLGLGEPIGTGVLRTANETPGGGSRTIELLGDPTLRMQITEPVSHLSAAIKNQTVTLSWSPSSESAAQYFVYRARAAAGPFTRLTPAALSGTTFSDPAPPVGLKVYQVRALQLVTTGSGSFTNLSQGIFVTVN
jgi:hypothetical protein